MKTLLHYLNWALHDINNFVWHGLIKPYLKVLLVGAVFFAIALGPVFIPGMTIDTLTIWASLVIIVSPFIFMSVRIYFERRNPVIHEPEVMIESYTGLPMYAKPEELPEPLTMKQSMKSSLSWTIYLYGILIGTAMLYTLWGEHSRELFQWQ